MDSDLPTAIRSWFVTGFVFIAPLAVSFVVISFVFRWLVGFVDPFLQLWPGEVGLLEQSIGVLSVLVGITLLGLVVRRWATEGFLHSFDRAMEMIPIVASIYSPTRRASSALLEHGDQFDRVALVEWPRADLNTLGFVTDVTPETVQSNLEDEETHYNVFVPMSPNPMGGFLAVVPESKLTHTDLTIKEGLELVVTTGLSGDEQLHASELRQWQP